MIEYLIWVLIDFSVGFVVGYLCGKRRYDLALLVIATVIALWLYILYIMSISDIRLTVTAVDRIAIVVYFIVTLVGCEVGYGIASG